MIKPSSILLHGILLGHFVSTSTARSDKISARECTFLTNLTISVFNDPPYVNNKEGMFIEFTRSVLQSCFRSPRCPPKYTKELELNVVESIEELVSIIEARNTNMAFPIPPSLNLQGSRFPMKSRVQYFPILKSPGPALVVDYKACRKLTRLMMTRTIYSVWPLLVFTLLLAGISGVCIWGLEYNSGNDQFSRPFVRGSYEGFWWAVVSMTSVGYGDHIPRSIAGRLFAIVWILTGVTVVSVLTATITSAITVVSVNQQCQGMQGKHIAVLNNSEAETDARHHGANVTTYEDANTMFSALRSGTIEGVLLDRLKAYYYLNKMNDDHLRVSRLFASPTSYSVAVVHGGASDFLMANSCFVGMLESPRGRMNKIIKKYIDPVKPMSSSSDDAVGIFPSESTMIRNLLLALGIVLAVFVLCGALWEILYRKKNCFRSTSVPNQVLVNNTEVPLHNLGGDQLTQVETAIQGLTAEVEKLKVALRGRGGNVTKAACNDRNDLTGDMRDACVNNANDSSTNSM